MKKIGCFPTVILTGVTVWLLSCLYLRVFPADESVVKLPMGEANARFQIWGSLLGSRPYTLRIDTPRGTISEELWVDWGPANELNLYRTPKEWLVGIGGGGESVIIDVVNPAGPRTVLGEEQRRTDDRDWVFLGVVTPYGFTPAALTRECIALFGAGESPYRKSFQSESFCSSKVSEQP